MKENEIPVPFFFENQKEWRDWLIENHNKFREIWIKYYKKNSGKPSLVYREALEEALCFGWIDGMVKRIDDECYMQRFTPRRPTGNWSEVNINLALQLQSEGRMHSSGLKFSHRWIPARSNEVHREISEASVALWEDALKKYPVAEQNFNALAPSHRKNYLRFINDAKRLETRQKRIAESIALLLKGEKLGLK
jgi:uncharacterized protein YdeI (YjbR/CyaY-like superfamily)